MRKEDEEKEGKRGKNKLDDHCWTTGEEGRRHYRQGTTTRPPASSWRIYETAQAL